MNEPRDTGGRLTVPPYTQRCGRCGQDWWDSHVCPALTAAVPLPATLPMTVRVSAPATLTDEQIDAIAEAHGLKFLVHVEHNRRKFATVEDVKLRQVVRAALATLASVT